MNKQEQIEFDEIKKERDQAKSNVDQLINECNSRGEIINSQARQLREKNAKILDLYNDLCSALKQNLYDFNEIAELRAKIKAYEEKCAVLEKQIAEWENLASNGTTGSEQ